MRTSPPGPLSCEEMGVGLCVRRPIIVSPFLSGIGIGGGLPSIVIPASAFVLQRHCRGSACRPHARLPAEGFGKDQKIAKSNGAVAVYIITRIIPDIAKTQPEMRGKL